MGSNESFPPPPPPGQPPQQPAWQPTQQMPTQAFPQQVYTPQAAVSAPKKGNGLLIGGGLVVVAALIGGVVLLTGGDDDKKSTSITLAPVTTLAVVDTTIAIDTTIAVVDTTIAIDTTVADDGLIEVFDDTGTFSIILPNDLETDTTPIGPTGATPSIRAAVVLDDFRNEEVTFGLIAVAGAVGSDLGSDAAEALAWMNPPDGVCTGRVDDTVETALGLAMRASFTGCGVDAGNKILMAIQLAGRPVLIGIYMQGTADLVTLGSAAQFALESMFVF